MGYSLKAILLICSVSNGLKRSDRIDRQQMIHVFLNLIFSRLAERNVKLMTGLMEQFIVSLTYFVIGFD